MGDTFSPVQDAQLAALQARLEEVIALHQHAATESETLRVSEHCHTILALYEAQSALLIVTASLAFL